MKTTTERKASWSRTCANASARGIVLEGDPAFLGWIDEWIAGKITMQVVQKRYAALVQSRSKSRVGSPPPAITFLEEVFAEFPDVAGLQQRQPQDRHDTSDAIDAAWTNGGEPT